MKKYIMSKNAVPPDSPAAQPPLPCGPPDPPDRLSNAIPIFPPYPYGPSGPYGPYGPSGPYGPYNASMMDFSQPYAYNGHDPNTMWQHYNRANYGYDYEMSQIAGSYPPNFPNSAYSQQYRKYLHARRNFPSGHFEVQSSMHYNAMNFMPPLPPVPPPPSPPPQDPPADIHVYQGPPPPMARAQASTSTNFGSTAQELKSAGYPDGFRAGPSNSNAFNSGWPNIGGHSSADTQHTFSRPPQMARAQTSTSGVDSASAELNSSGRREDIRARPSTGNTIQRELNNDDNNSSSSPEVQEIMDISTPPMSRAQTLASVIYDLTNDGLDTEGDLRAVPSTSNGSNSDWQNGHSSTEPQRTYSRPNVQMPTARTIASIILDLGSDELNAALLYDYRAASSTKNRFQRGLSNRENNSPPDRQDNLNTPAPMSRASSLPSMIFDLTNDGQDSTGSSDDFRVVPSTSNAVYPGWQNAGGHSSTDTHNLYDRPPPQIARAHTATPGNEFQAGPSTSNAGWPINGGHSSAENQHPFSVPPPPIARAQTSTSVNYGSRMEEQNSTGIRAANDTLRNTLKRVCPHGVSDASNSKRTVVEDNTDQTSSPSNKMKKYIRSKNAVASDSPPPIPGTEEGMNPAVQQPPLPLEPPPLDKPPNGSVGLKEEVEDVDYSDSASTSTSASGSKSSESDSASNVKAMCRDFVRGKCTRHGTCRFSHKCDVSQLAGVYTFCNDFQNSVCTRPVCKYVHATVFEEQRFYRTGELPPHAFAHKNVNLLPPPPPPPPEDVPADLLQTFTVPPPPTPARATKPPPVLDNLTAGTSDSRGFPDDLPPVWYPSVYMNREWAKLKKINVPCDLKHEPDNLQKRCNRCEVNDLRIEYLVDKIEKVKKARGDRTQTLKLLTMKRERLQTTLSNLLRPTYHGLFAPTALPASQNLSPERQKVRTGWNTLEGKNTFNLLAKLRNEFARQNSEPSRNT